MIDLRPDGLRSLAGRTLKTYVRGTHRMIPPAETLARLKPLLPKMGITRLANVTGLDVIGIPVVMSVRPCSRSLSVSQGKGLDLDSAKVSAAMESVEGYHAERVTGPLELASYDDLCQTHSLVDPFRLPLSIVRPFQTSLPLLWIAGDDWLRHERVWVPFQLVHTAYTTRMRWDLVGFAVSSTGLASGNHVLEAVSHALCEIVERDATARFAAQTDEDREARRLDLRTVDDPDCCAVLMGALRAAELAPFGMVGVGTIFEAYRDGRLEDDDEVAVVHGPEDTGYRAGSDAMVNIRATVGKARSSGVLDEESAAGMLGVAKRLYYAERTYARVMEIAEAEGIPASTLESFRRWLPAGAVNQKRDDAVAMLQVMHACLDAGCAPGPPAFVFEDSLWWHELRVSAAETGMPGDDARVLAGLSRDPELRERTVAAALGWQLALKEVRRDGTSLCSRLDLPDARPSTAGWPRITAHALASSTFSKRAPSPLAPRL